jgi:hypothetical protein
MIRIFMHKHFHLLPHFENIEVSVVSRKHRISIIRVPDYVAFRNFQLKLNHKLRHDLIPRSTCCKLGTRHITFFPNVQHPLTTFLYYEIPFYTNTGLHETKLNKRNIVSVHLILHSFLNSLCLSGLLIGITLVVSAHKAFNIMFI